MTLIDQLYRRAAGSEIHFIRWCQDLNPKGRLTFTKTRDTQQGSPHFSVTLGILPDYTFGGSGVAPMGSARPPAQGAGMKPGDRYRTAGHLAGDLPGELHGGPGEI